jgi:polysaccharide biosynthesis transport protein
MSSLPGPSMSVSMEPVGPGDSRLGPPGSNARPTPPENGDQPIFRLDLLRSIQLHRGMLLAFALAGLLLGVAYYLSMWKVYLAQSVVYVQPAPQTILERNDAPRWPFDSNTYESYIAQQMLNVSRGDVLAAALHKLGHGKWWGPNESEQAAVERLRRTIEVTREGTSYQFSIGARAASPDDAAKIANTVAASYIESEAGEQKAGDTQRLTVLGEERDRIQKELTADRTEQEALNKQLGQASIGSTAPDHYDDDIGRIRAELVKARTDHDDAAARYTSVGAAQGPSSTALNAEADELIANDAGLVSMKTALNTRRAVLISQMANLTPSHPQYKQDSEELAKINASLESMASELRTKAAARIQLKLRSDLERTAGVEAQLNSQLGQLTGAAGNATSKLQRSSDLVADITRLQARFATIDEQWRNLTLEVGAPGSAFMITPAMAPLHTAKSGALRNALAIVILGIVFGLLAAMLAHRMDPRVYIAADVEQVLGFAPIAQLPDFDEVPDGVAEEHLLRLATAIEYARKQGDLKSCIFTGAGAGTGVTTVVARMRAILESMGRTTVIVDASGTPPPAPRVNSDSQGEQALATIQRSSRSSALVRQMAEETETQEGSLVLTDTAPLVVSAETEYLARHVDCAIVIVASGVTTRAQLREVAATLLRLDVATVGFVLNRIGLRKADPAFRHSVRAIEDHLSAQSEAHATRTVRSQPFPIEEPFAGEEFAANQAANKGIPAEAAVSAPPQPVVSAQSAPPMPVAQIPDRPSPDPAPPLTIHEQLFVPTEPSPVPPRTSRTQPPAIPLQAPPIPASPDPWWLAQVLHQPDAPIDAPLPQSAMVAETRIAAPIESATVPSAQAAKSAEPLRVFEALPATAVPQPLPMAPKADPMPRRKVDVASSPAPHAAPPANVSAPAAWEPAPVFASPIDTRPVPEKAQEADPARTSSHVASRFDGLRNLVTVLGLREMHKTEVPHEPAPKPAPRADRLEKLSVFERAFVPAPEPVSASVASASPRLVTAHPEFLPPQPIVYTPAADRRAESGASDGPDRRSGDDEVRILPSRRGQYKRK